MGGKEEGEKKTKEKGARSGAGYGRAKSRVGTAAIATAERSTARIRRPSGRRRGWRGTAIVRRRRAAATATARGATAARR